MEKQSTVRLIESRPNPGRVVWERLRSDNGKGAE